MLSKPTKQQRVFARRIQACCGLEGPVLSLLLDRLQIFDKAFFFDSLIEHISGIKVVEDDRDGAKNGYWDMKTGIININLVNRGVKGEQLSHRYVAVLLHECVHVFQWTYSCGGWQRCPFKCETYWARGTHIGKTGHGALWCEAMVAIKHLFEKALGWGIDCGFPQSVQKEVEWGIHSGWTPSDTLLRSCGLKFSESGERVFQSSQESKRQGK